MKKQQTTLNHAVEALVVVRTLLEEKNVEQHHSTDQESTLFSSSSLRESAEEVVGISEEFLHGTSPGLLDCANGYGLLSLGNGDAFVEDVHGVVTEDEALANDGVQVYVLSVEDRELGHAEGEVLTNETQILARVGRSSTSVNTDHLEASIEAKAEETTTTTEVKRAVVLDDFTIVHGADGGLEGSVDATALTSHAC